MRMRIAKEFIWEMSHRLPFHKGGCQNIHGHSYKLRIEVEGTTDSNGMIMDYYDMSTIMDPVIFQLDHSFIVDENDELMLNFLKENDFKHYVIDRTTTAENIAIYLLELVKPKFANFTNIDKLKIRFHETADVFAEIETEI